MQQRGLPVRVSAGESGASEFFFVDCDGDIRFARELVEEIFEKIFQVPAPRVYKVELWNMSLNDELIDA